MDSVLVFQFVLGLIAVGMLALGTESMIRQKRYWAASALMAVCAILVLSSLRLFFSADWLNTLAAVSMVVLIMCAAAARQRDEW